MGRTAFSENYSVCLKEDGSPREISRSGAVVTYKAIGYDSGQAVALQLIPVTSLDSPVRARFEEQARTVQKLQHVNVARVLDFGVEDDHIVFVSEYLQGETADAWVVAHGPMPPDAVLRIGLQVLSALEAAAFHSLTHRSIQPSTLMIVPGVAPDGGWPFIKLLNFGLAGLKLYSQGNEPHELVPSISPQFASPEQLDNGIVDFRSEIFSLGATMCFVLTGAVPLAGVPDESGIAERVLPPGNAIPRSIRQLLVRMLRHKPEERPQDPVAFAEEMRASLQKIERKTAFTRRFGPPFESPSSAVPVEPRRRSLVSAPLAMAAILLLLAMLGAFVLPTRVRALVHRNRDIKSVGVPIGVPETTATAEKAQAAPTLPERNETKALAASVAQNGLASPPAQPVDSPLPTRSAAPVLANNPVSSPAAPVFAVSPTPARYSTETAEARQFATNIRATEAPPPAEGPEPSNPSENATAEQNPADDVAQNATEDATAAPRKAAPVESEPASAKSRKGILADKRGATATRRRIAKAGSDRAVPLLRVGSVRAEFVGTTNEGNWVLQLPTGNTVVTPPVPDVTGDPPLIRGKKVKKVRVEPRAIRADQQPPVVVLPPDA